jgi:Mg/Co/Ni transporter MgtE
MFPACGENRSPAVVAGSMLPFLLRRLGFDPASASAPFVATLVDVTGRVIYSPSPS